MTPRPATGTILEDPLAALPIGAKLLFRQIAVGAVGDQEHATVRNWGDLRGAVLALAFPDAVDSNVFGSAIMVAPGLALAATHVLDPYRHQIEAGSQTVWCFGLDGERLNGWAVTSIVTGDRSDVAMLVLRLSTAVPDDRTFAVATISTRTPAVDEVVTMLGFTQGPAVESRPGASRTLSVSLRASKGRVTQQYPHRVDSFLKPYPALEVWCPTVGGMSGGPVFDANGHLIGLVTASLRMEDGTDVSPTFASLIWPALGRQFEGTWPPGCLPYPTSLLDLPPSWVSINGREALHRDGPNVTYHQWT